MGTNFYIKGHRGSDDLRYRIGKRSAIGNGQTLFIWFRPIGKIRRIVDDYGRIYTIAEFEQILQACSSQSKKD